MEIVDAKFTLDLKPTRLTADVGVPRGMEAFLTLDNGYEVTLDIQVIDRVPCCVGLSVNGPGITSEGLRFPVQTWVERLMASVGMIREPLDGDRVAYHLTANSDDRRRVNQAVRKSVRKRRNSTGIADLKRVADAYRTGGVAGVKSVMDVKEAQAYRYIRKAREAGVLVPREG